MSKQWQGMDLKGGGLQQAQLAYKAAARTHLGAYARWILFPLGLHRFYLKEPRGGVAYIAASALAAGAHAAAGLPWLWLIPAVAALADLFWIPGRLVRLNKEIRMQTMMGNASRGAPRGFQGHYTDDNTTEDAGPGGNAGQ
jgi:TM2 domain-containing membrane protein YozV